MPRISRYNHDIKRLEWVEASEEEHAAWKAARAKKVGGPGASRARSHHKRPAAATATETLEGPESAADAIREAAKASGAKGRKPSPGNGPLTPVVSLFSRLGGIVLIRGTHTLTGGRHTMTPAEAISIAAPAIRILNKELGKRIHYTPKVGGEYAAEIERIGTGVASWVLRGIAKATGTPVEVEPHTTDTRASAQARPAQPAPVPQPDLVDMALSPETVQAPEDDTADLFAGSEPIPMGAGGSGPRSVAGPSPSRPAVTSAGRASAPPGAMLGVPESVWNSVSTPDIGLAEVMG